MRSSRHCKALIIGGALLLPAGATRPAYAHCDTMDGPVVAAAQRALRSGNVNYALFWVQVEDEALIRSAFQRNIRVRKQSAAAREIADLWFYETLVRVHSEGEGAPYTWIKPAGTKADPAIAAADSALATRSVLQLEKLLIRALHDGLRVRFQAGVGGQKLRGERCCCGTGLRPNVRPPDPLCGSHIRPWQRWSGRACYC